MFHHHSSVGKAICFVSSLLLSLGAIAVGLLAFNYDVINSPFVQTHLHQFVYPVELLIGLAGIAGLFFTFFGGLVADRCECCSRHDATHRKDSNHRHD